MWWQWNTLAVYGTTVTFNIMLCNIEYNMNYTILFNFDRFATYYFLLTHSLTPLSLSHSLTHTYRRICFRNPFTACQIHQRQLAHGLDLRGLIFGQQHHRHD